MSLWAIVPFRSVATGKARLSGAMTQRQRGALNRKLLMHTLNVLRQVRNLDQLAVVTSDPGGEEIAAATGTLVINDGSATDLNSALERGRQFLLARGAQRMLVVFSDLPLLRLHEVEGLLARGSGRLGAVVAPDRAGSGTNALYIDPPDALDFCFGPMSLHRYLHAAQAAAFPLELYWSPGTQFDIDLPADLATWARAERRAHGDQTRTMS